MNLMEEIQEFSGMEINEGKKLRKSLAIVATLTLLGLGTMGGEKKDWKEGLTQTEQSYVQKNKPYFEERKSSLIKTGVGGKELNNLMKKSVIGKMQRDGVI